MAGERRLFLTGGGGMLGRNILEHPDAARFDIDAPRSRQLDLRDYAATEAWLRRGKPDVVVHCAGLVGGIQANISRPVDFLVANLDMGRNVLMAARAAGVADLINLGSSCMYPRDAPHPLTEDLVLKGELEPTNEGYAIAKVATARLAEYMSREDGALRYRTLIPCNLYGRHDKFDPRHSHLVPAVIHKIHRAKVEGKDSVEVWGDGTARREFMDARDAAGAVLKAAADCAALPPMMNIGLGRDYSIDDYYETVARVIGWTGSLVHLLDKPVGMKRKLVDISLQTRWGWAPAISLEDGLRSAYEFYLEEWKP